MLVLLRTKTLSLLLYPQKALVDSERVNKAVQDLELIKSSRERLLRLYNYVEDSTVSFFQSNF